MNFCCCTCYITIVLQNYPVIQGWAPTAKTLYQWPKIYEYMVLFHPTYRGPQCHSTYTKVKVDGTYWFIMSHVLTHHFGGES